MERYLEAMIAHHQETIDVWRRSDALQLCLRHAWPEPVGVMAVGERVTSKAQLFQCNGAFLCLRRDRLDTENPLHAKGYRVHNLYPIVAAATLEDGRADFQLLGGYFHQNWFEDYATPNQAVAAFIREWKEDVSAARAKLEDALRGTDLELESYRQDIACAYEPGLFHPSLRAWLEDVVWQLREAEAGTRDVREAGPGVVSSFTSRFRAGDVLFRPSTGALFRVLFVQPMGDRHGMHINECCRDFDTG